MHVSRRIARTLTLLFTLPAATLAAQGDPTEGPVGPPPPEKYVPPSQKLEWPRDEDRPVCVVDGQRHTLREVLEYIDRRHAPMTIDQMGTPSGKALLESPQMPVLVRQYADVMALKAEAESLDIAEEHIASALSASLKRSFEKHLEGYVEQREQSGRPVELTQKRINILLEHYQNRHGLETEIQGWLDAIVPETPLEADGVLRDYYRDRVQIFGGQITLSHILVRHRDPRTGELLTGDAAKAAIRRVADVQSRLKQDGSNFEDVARLLSEDRITAEKGGILEDVRRFDPRLPAALCRTAWKLVDGDFTETPVESAYGLHFVKRLRYRNQYYVYYHQDLKPEIVEQKRREEQEDQLWAARRDRRVKLLY